MKLALIALFIPAVVAAQNATTIFKPISLQEAIELAHRNSPSAVQARGAIDNAAGQVKTTFNTYFPTVSASAGQSQSAGPRPNTDGTITPYVARPWSYSTGLSTRLTLFDGGKRKFDLDARRAELRSAETSESAVRFNIALQVKQQYYAILASREAESAARIALDIAQQQLDAARARVNAGAAIISDSLRSFLAVGNAQLAVRTAQANVANASTALTRVVGSDVLVTAFPSDTSAVAVVPIDSASIVNLATNGPTVRQAQATVTAATAAVKSARTSYLPTISSSFGYSGSGFDRGFGVGGGSLSYSRNLSLSAAWNIWDGFARSEAVSRAQVTVANNEAQLRDARLLAQQNILQQIATLRNAEERMRIQQLSVMAAQEDLRVQQQRYNLGSSTQLEVSTSQNALNSARQSLIQARLDYRIARAQIEAIIGQDLG